MKFDLDGNLKSVDADTAIGSRTKTGNNGAVTTLSVSTPTPPAPPRPAPLKKPIRFVDTTLAQELLRREVLTTAQAAQMLDITVEEFLTIKSEHSIPVVAGYDAAMIRDIADKLNTERDRRGENVPE